MFSDLYNLLFSRLNRTTKFLIFLRLEIISKNNQNETGNTIIVWGCLCIYMVHIYTRQYFSHWSTLFIVTCFSLDSILSKPESPHSKSVPKTCGAWKLTQKLWQSIPIPYKSWKMIPIMKSIRRSGASSAELVFRKNEQVASEFYQLDDPCCIQILQTITM